jgi:hypothetical protein
MDGALHPIHQRDWIHPSNTSLPIKCVCLHPSEEHQHWKVNHHPQVSLWQSMFATTQVRQHQHQKVQHHPWVSLWWSMVVISWSIGLLRGFTHQVWLPRATLSQERRPTNCGSKTDGGNMPCRTSNCRHQSGLRTQAHPLYCLLKRNQSPTTTRCAPLVLPWLTPPRTCWPSGPNWDAQQRRASHGQNKNGGGSGTSAPLIVTLTWGNSALCRAERWEG